MSDFRTVPQGHKGVLNAIREDQVGQGVRLSAVDKEMRRGFARVDAEFANARAEIRDGFGSLAQGQEQITELITQHIEECEKN